MSINWGLWENVGITAHGPPGARRQLEGFGQLTVEQALSHLDALTRTSATQIGVSPIEFSKLPELFQRLPLFRAFARPKSPEESGKRVFRDRLDGAPAGRRRALLEKFVQESVASVLGAQAGELTDRRAGFSSLGMDSLATLELRNRLQSGLRESLPAALAFHYPNLETLTDFLAEGILQDHAGSKEPPNEARPDPPSDPGVSGSDLSRKLAERMASLRNSLDASLRP
jgi:acyl carrier protein